jgi:predicted DNA-binding ribbon-helix-helix protein
MVGDATSTPMRGSATIGSDGGLDPADDAALPRRLVLEPPAKRSVTIAGHQTSITLEPMFWDALDAAAQTQNLPLNALIARIDVLRLDAENSPNLASALRQWVLVEAQKKGPPD